MTTHEWRESTSDGPRLFKATRFARQWTLAMKLKREPEWIDVPPPFPAEIVTQLRDLLWTKYQRRRVPFEVVREIDRLLPPEQRITETE